MSDDLRRNHLPAGVAREAVLRLLGSPTESDGAGLHYDVGGYWLDVLLDADGRVCEAILGPY